MKKYLSKAMAYAAMLLMTTVLYACKDDDGPSADKFYRIYMEYVAANPRDNRWSMTAYGKWSNPRNTITLTSYNSSDKTYNEESPENFRIVELDKDELILEYHENRPDGENYGKITLRQIADKGDIYEEEVTVKLRKKK